VNKRLVVMIQCAPLGNTRFSEGLRLAMGLVACTDELAVSVILKGDGVYGALAKTERGEVSRYLATMAEWDVEPLVEAESLAERGLGRVDLASGFKAVSRSRVLELLTAARFVINF